MIEEAEPARAGTLLEWLRLQRIDVIALVSMTVIAFVIRFFSPITPNFIAHPGSGPAISTCISSTPVDAKGDLGTLCGLAYPFTRGYPDAGGNLQPPNGQVFDEVYFPVDARDDVKGIQQCRPTMPAGFELGSCPYNYFDPEPPLAKEVIATGEIAYGWYRATFEGAKGDYVDLGFNTYGWRIAVCLVGTLCVPLIYLLALRLWPNRLFAIAAAIFVCFDGMFFIQSRIGMIDIIPTFLIMLCYYLFLVHRQSRTPATSVVTLLLLGLAISVGIASKWIVLAAFASILFFLFGKMLWTFAIEHRIETPGGADWRLYGLVAAVAFVLLPVLIYIGSWFPFFERGQFHTLADLIQYNKDAYEYHAHLVATHPYGSPWWSWPLLARPVLYYAQYQDLGTDQFTGQPLYALIYNLGNPWIWWTSLPCVLSLPYFIIRHRSLPAAVILMGFITQYLPWAPITRVLFIYEMIAGLIFMVLALAFVLAKIAEAWPAWGRKVAIAHLGVTVTFFLYFYPVWAAIPIGADAWQPGPHTPPWGPKKWLLNCPDIPESQPKLFCWN